MNDLRTFSNSEFGSVRAIEKDGQAWFVGKDVATALGYCNTPDAISKHVATEDKGVAKCDTLGGKQEVTIINESGVYSLIFGSTLPRAKEFKHWVTSEVLPSIRKNGGYVANQENMTDDELLSKALMVAQNIISNKDKLIAEQKAQIEADRPKTIFADALTASESTILVRDMAKMLYDNGVKTGEKRFYDWLRNNGYICQHSTTPTQKAMELGLFEIDTHSIQRNGMALPIETQTTRVTTKGQMYFINKFLNKEKSHA